MNNKTKLLLQLVLIITIIIAGLFSFTQTALAYEYETNLLTTTSVDNHSSGDRKTLIYKETIELSQDDIIRANNGELYYNAHVHLGAKGLRKVGSSLSVVCYDDDGGTLISGYYSDKNDPRSVSNYNHEHNSGDIYIPAKTAKIYYQTTIQSRSKCDLDIFDMYLKLYDNVKPKFNSARLATKDGTYPAGETIRYAVKVSEPVNVINEGIFNVEVGSDLYTAEYVDQNDDRNELYYDFKIPDSDTLGNKLKIKMSSIEGLVVEDDAENQSTITKESLSDNSKIFADNKPPSSKDFKCVSSGNTYYKTGGEIKFDVKFDEEIKVDETKETPYISLSNGQRALCNNIDEKSHTDTASFEYTVSSSDSNTSNLTITGVDFIGIVDQVTQSAIASLDDFVNMSNIELNKLHIGIDTEAPSVNFTNPGDDYHKSDYVVEIQPTDNLSGVGELFSAWTTSSGSNQTKYQDVKYISGSDAEISNPTSSGIYYLWIKADDEAGNSAVIQSPYTYKFDFTPPEIIIEPSYINGCVESVSVDVIDNVDVKTKKYEWGNSEGCYPEADILEDQIPLPDKGGTYSLTVTAIDSVENTSEKTLIDLEIDKTGPAVSFTPSSISTHAKSHEVSIEVSDEKTGVKSYEYLWSKSMSPSEAKDELGWQDTTDTLFTTPIGVEGNYYLHIKAIDKVGNDTHCVSGVFNIDNTPPTVSITPDGNSECYSETKYEIGIIVEDTVTTTAALNISYAFSTSESSEGLEFSSLTGDKVILEDLKVNTYLYIKATDKVGNTTIFKSNAFISDTTPPTASIENLSGEYINKNAVELYFRVTDDYSMDDDIKMKLIIDDIEGDWESFLLSKTVEFNKTEGNHTVSVKFKDKCDNESNLYSTCFIYDITPPEVSIDYEPKTTTSGSVIATVTTTTSSSIVGEDSHVFLENGSYTFEACDEAGNTTKKDAVVSWIDKTAPTISFSSDEFDNKKHKSATVKINCEDNQSDILGVKYRIVKDGSEKGLWQDCNNGELVDISGVSDGKYYIEAKAKDGVGNESTKSSSYVDIDVTKPTWAIKYSITTRTAQNVVAEITFDEEANVTNNDKRNTYVFKDNGEFTFEFEDEAGNSSTAVAKVDWIDLDMAKASIKITDENLNEVSQDKWVNYDLFVTITPPAQSTIDDLTFNGDLVSEITTGSAISPDIEDCGNNSYLVKNYGVFNFIVHDIDTSLESEGEITVRIDKNKPEFVSEVRTTNTWTNEDVIVTITATDDLSSVTYTGGDSYKFTENGSHTFIFTDEAGNECSYTTKVENIDKSAPKVNVSYTVDGESYDHKYTNKDITVKVDFDDLSPVTITNNGGIDKYIFTSNGEFTFEYTDEAGNSGSKKVVIDKIDKTAPTAYVTYSSTTWTNNDVVATLNVSDELGGSGVANDGETYTFIANGDHKFVAKDNAGNEINITASSTRIDKTPPILSYSISPSGRTPFSVFATVTANESVNFINNGGSPSMQFKSNGSYTFKAKDYAGNESEIEVNVTNISRESTPVILKYSKIEPTNEDVYVTIYPEDKENDVIFVINNDNSKTHRFIENGEFSFRYRNPAGIMGEITASVTNIDKIPPVVTSEYSTTNITADNVIATLTANKDVIYPFAAIDGTYTFYKNKKVKIPVRDILDNKTYVLLDVDWIDKDAPEIVLQNQYECISMGDMFNADVGVSVTDANDIPNGLEIIGEADTSTIGDYEITYKATDIAGNTAEMKKYVTVYDPNKFNVIINDRMPVNSEVEIIGNNMILETINQTGNLKLLLAPGKKKFGYFKRNGVKINNEYTFESKGYYTLYIQDDNRNTKLVYVFVK